MRTRIYQYPKKMWVQSENGWYSVPRSKNDIEIAKRSISAMTFVPVREISWIPNHHHFIVHMP